MQVPSSASAPSQASSSAPLASSSAQISVSSGTASFDAAQLPRDIGTMSVADAKRALYGPDAGSARVFAKLHEDKDYAALGQWGKETPEEIEEKSKSIQAARRRVNDKHYLVRKVVALAAGALGVGFGTASLLERVFKVSPAWSKRLGALLVLVLLIRKYGAKSNSDLSDAVKRKLRVLPFLGAAPTMALNTHRIHNFMLDAFQTADYKTVEINIPGATFLSLMDLRDREYVLKGNMRNYLKNAHTEQGGHDPANFEYIFAEVLGRGIFATDKKEWQDHRKIASNMFSGNGLRTQMEHVFNRHADQVVAFFRRASRRNQVVDVQDVYQCAVFDGFCEVAFGIYPNTLESVETTGKKPQFLISFDFCQAVGAQRLANLPVVWSLLRFLGIGEEGQVGKHAKFLVDYIIPVIHKRKQEEDLGDRNDLLSLYIAHARKTQQAHMLEDEYLLDLILNFMVAGRDTTACLLTNVTRYLSENPRCRDRVVRDFELLDNTVVSMESAKTTPYADAVVNEVLRLQPSVGNDFRLAVEDDVLPSGIKVVAGTRMMISNLAIGRDPLLWRDPEAFVPERWLQGDAKTVKRVDEYVHPVFWGGPRLCLGKDMARFEGIVFMRKLFTQFEFELVADRVDESYHPSPVIFYVDGLECRIKERAIPA